MHILLVGEYPLNVLKSGYLFMRMVVRQGPSRALICNKKHQIMNHIQDNLSDFEQAKLSSLFLHVHNKINSNT